MRELKLLLVLMFLSSVAFAQKSIKLEIKENKAPCTGVAPMECMQVKEGKNWTLFYNTIEGFDYEPGYRYKLRVVRTEVDKPPADASKYHYKLKKVLRKKAVVMEEFINKKLVLTQMNGKPITQTSFYGTLNFNTGTFSGKSGCNNFNIPFDIDKKKISFGHGIGTLMACAPDLMELEDEFNRTLGGNTFKIKYKGQTIRLINAKTGETAVVFNQPSTHDVLSFINQKEWKLIMLDNIAKDYGKASIRLDTEEGRVNGNSGCNSFFGGFETDGDKISMPALATTRMACIDEDRSNTERKVLGYLSDGNLRFDVADQTLNFYVKDKLVMIFGLVWDK